MKLTNTSAVPVYTISGSSTARPLPEWLARKRKRSLKQDPEFTNRIELLQDFEFEEASSCVRASDDGDWVVSTGTYKPQIHVHYLPHLSLSFARHTDTLNQTFLLLSSDYTKSLHLQTDRCLQFHTPGGCYYSTRIPRYGRDLKYDKRAAEALIPSVGVNASGNGEVFRLNLEVGRFMKGYEVDVGGDDFTSAGAGALQGGINPGSVNAAAIAEDSHNLLAFGTSLGTVEFWDSRSRTRVGLLSSPSKTSVLDAHAEITCLQFHPSGLTLATGSSTGLIHLHDLRSPTPLLKKDQGYGYPIHTLTFLTSSSTSDNVHLLSEPKILSSDKRIIKIWDTNTGAPWTSVEPAVNLHSVAWCKDSGMFLTANEGRQQHSFFIPSLGPAPKWCSFLDNLVEEMAEDPDDPNAFGASQRAGEVYDNYKFLSIPQLRALNLDHLVGTTGLLRPYMHGYFVAQQLYEEARVISQPELWMEQRQKSIREKVEKERESRIRGSKKVTVKVNKRLAERMLEREEKNEKRKLKRAIEKGEAMKDGTEPTGTDDKDDKVKEKNTSAGTSLLTDTRFNSLFQDEDFAVDETSHEFRALNASTTTTQPPSRAPTRGPRGLTAVEEEDLAAPPRSDSSDSSGDDSSDDDDDERQRSQYRHQQPDTAGRDKISTASYKKSGHVRQDGPEPRRRQQGPRMSVSSSSAVGGKTAKQWGSGDRSSFGKRAADASSRGGGNGRGGGGRFGGGSGANDSVVGERQITFAPAAKSGRGRGGGRGGGSRGDIERSGRGGGRKEWKDRRSASGNVMRAL